MSVDLRALIAKASGIESLASLNSDAKGSGSMPF